MLLLAPVPHWTLYRVPAPSSLSWGKHVTIEILSFPLEHVWGCYISFTQVEFGFSRHPDPTWQFVWLSQVSILGDGWVHEKTSQSVFPQYINWEFSFQWSSCYHKLPHFGGGRVCFSTWQKAPWSQFLGPATVPAISSWKAAGTSVGVTLALPCILPLPCMRQVLG